MRTAPAQNGPGREEGFILIEVLVSALILAMVAAGVLAVLSSTTHSAASERVRSQAAGLAQEDQARLRTMRLTKLNGLSQTQSGIMLDGTEFTVESEGTFVNATSNEVACTGEKSVADYIRTTSRVTTSSMRTPVVLRSIVSPSSGSLDQNHGILSFSVTNADAVPVSGISLSGQGSVNFSGRTDSTGCVNFADLPTGSYSVTIAGNGMVNPKGEYSTTKSFNAPTANTQRVPLQYDSPGGVEPKFKYRVGGSETFLAGTVDSISVYNSQTGATVPTTIGVPGSARSSPFAGPTNLFPFNSKTVVYAGVCASNNADPNLTSPEKQKALALVEVQPGQIATPEIQLPALNLTLTSNGVALKGARVTTQDTAAGCEYASKPVKRLYSTEAAGHLSTMVKNPNGGGEIEVPDAGMPWGKYKVCASALYSGSQRHVESTVAVEDLKIGTSLELDLKNGTSGACSWP